MTYYLFVANFNMIFTYYWTELKLERPDVPLSHHSPVVPGS